MRARATQLAEAYLSVAQGHIGETRAAFDEACAEVHANAHERKLALGIRKLVEDGCTFESDDRVDARTLRRQVFSKASEWRQGLELGEVFDRDAVLEEVARERGQNESPADLLRALYTDLREANLLADAPATEGPALVNRYDMAQAQAVLLRATKVTAEIQCQDPATYRNLFGKLKFRRLLYTIHRQGDLGYRVELSGPFSLFSSVTKYGLQLALVLPVIQQCDRWSIRAHLLWGKDRRNLRFELSGGSPARARKALSKVISDKPQESDLPDEVAELITKVRALDSDWSVSPASEILDLPGLGLCVPDLRFFRAATGTAVFLEVMGFWSRDAVWKRVELVQAGLPDRVLFAVPKRLRVSDEVLDEDLPGQLYVYKGKMNAKAILQRLDGMTSPS